MTGFFSRHAARLCLCLTAIGSHAACTDLPTGTDSFQLEADGQLWVAVVPPLDLPDAASWLAHSAADPGATAVLRTEVESLQREALRARAAGNAARAHAALRDAADRAVAPMADAPARDAFDRGIASLEGWQRGVESDVDLTRQPGLVDALAEVERERVSAAAALAADDFRGAALLITRAAERVRDWAPQGVALRILDRVDAHLAASAPTSDERERAAHLLQSARYELIGGNSLRAMQRALYALQLAGGNGVEADDDPRRSRCGEYAC